MKKTIKRGIAKAMYEALAGLPLGHLASEELEKVMDNMVALSAPYEHHNKLMQELGKRLYDGIEQDRIHKFNSMLALASKAENIEKSIAIQKAVKAEYADLYELLTKQNNVEASLLNKDVELELNEVDKKSFVKAVLKGKPEIALAEFELFAPMYSEKAEKKEEAEDYSELDELLAEQV